MRRAKTDPTMVREHNAALLLNHIWHSEGISRADLAREAGLARSTVSTIVSDLLESCLVRECEVARTGVGRPPILLRFDDERFALVGIDMGASHVAAVLTDLRGRVKAVARRDHDVQGDPPGTLRLMRRHVDQCLDEAGVRVDRVVGIGVAVPCPVELDDADRLSARILPHWKDVRVGDMLRYNYDLPVFVDNDANLGALSERWWGAGRHTPDFAYIKVATGVGSGLIFDGEIFRGAAGIAGEIGHTAVVEDGPACRCGLRGCLEALVGSESLLRRARELVAAGSDSVLDPTTLTTQAIVDAARAGDEVALRILDEVGRYLGIAVANLLNLLNPATVILGGSVSAAGELLLEPVRRAIRDRALWTSIARAEVVISPLGPDAVARGAAARVLQAALSDPRLFPNPTQGSRTAGGDVPSARRR